MNINNNKRKYNDIENTISNEDINNLNIDIKNESDIYNLNKDQLINKLNSLNLSNDGFDNELYDRMIKYYNIVNEDNKKQNNNLFNNYIPTLKIIDYISTTEILFWKVFRSKYLYINIMSNMNSKSMFTYNDITIYSLSYYSNSIDILKDKIKSNAFIHLNRREFNYLIKESKHINKIESRFYNSLIYNQFPMYFKINSCNIISIIKSNNCKILKLYIERNDLYSQPKIFNKLILDKNGNNILFTLPIYDYNDIYYRTKMLKYLISVKCLENLNNFDYSSHPKSLLDVNKNSLNVKQLIKLFKILSSIDSPPTRSYLMSMCIFALQVKCELKDYREQLKQYLNYNIKSCLKSIQNDSGIVKVIYQMIECIVYYLNLPSHYSALFYNSLINYKCNYNKTYSLLPLIKSGNINKINIKNSYWNKSLSLWILNNCGSAMRDSNNPSQLHLNVLINNTNKIVIITTSFDNYFNQLVKYGQYQQAINMLLYTLSDFKYIYRIPFTFFIECIYYYINKKQKPIIKKYIINILFHLSTPQLINALQYIGLYIGKDKLNIDDTIYNELYQKNINNIEVINTLLDFNYINNNKTNKTNK